MTSWLPNLWYRLSADSRATRIVFFIYAAKSTFLQKNAKIKCIGKWKNFDYNCEKKITLLPVVLLLQVKDSSTLTVHIVG